MEVLGSLEADILLALRRLRTAPARDLRAELERQGVVVAYTTVATCLARLWEKGLVGRRAEPCRGGKRYVYESVDFERRYLENILKGVVSLFGEAGVVHLNEELARRQPAGRPDIESRARG
jgi:predicted transcriptional regulator